jgi:hypothetical protein
VLSLSIGEIKVAIEDDMKALTAALNNIADKLPTGMSAATPAPAQPPQAASATTTRGPGRPRKISLDEVKTVAKKLADEKGRNVAVKLIGEHGAGQLADMEESKYSSFIAAADVLLQQQPEQADADL